MKLRQIWELFDWPLAFAALALMAIGIVGISSATGGHAANGMRTLALMQGIWVVLACGAALVAIGLPVRFWYGIAYLLYALVLGALAFTLVYGTQSMGATRWITLGPVRVQPSEIGKVALILALARLLSTQKGPVIRWWRLARVLLLTLVPIALIRAQPDLGTAMVYFVVALPMVYWAGLKNIHLFLLLSPVVNAVCAFAGWIPWAAFCLMFVGLLFLMRPSIRWVVLLVAVNLTVGIATPQIWEGLQPFQRRRIEAFFNPEKDPLGAGYQIIQSKVAIGSGGTWGKGFQKGSQTQLAFLPETHTDFIFAVLAEEFGFAGAISVLGLLFMLVWRIFRMALLTNNAFASFVCVGIGTMFAFHTIVNIGMTIGLMPVTGLPLPFVSYGGSAMVTNGFAAGLVLGFGLRRYE